MDDFPHDTPRADWTRAPLGPDRPPRPARRPSARRHGMPPPEALALTSGGGRLWGLAHRGLPTAQRPIAGAGDAASCFPALELAREGLAV